MKKIILLVLLFLNFLYSVEIDEYKVDLYYANGIMMQESKEEAQVIWENRVDDLLFSTPELFNRIGKTDVAYNISKGMAEDLFESFIQKTKLEPGLDTTWYVFKTIIGKIPYVGTSSAVLLNSAEYATEIIHDGTLNTQKANYKESIEAGHGVVVVAHSQGNLFTQEAYRDLVAESKDGWMGKYFHVISVATPGSEIPNGGHGIIFDNDFITVIPNGMKSNITTNPNRRDVYIYNALGDLIGTDKDIKSIQYHGFEYYMGYKVWEKMLDTSRPGEYVRSTKVKTDKAKTLIMGWVVDEIYAHNSRPSHSQWEIKKEMGCVCKEKYVEMTHKYDPALMDIRLEDEKVKDFTSATGGESKIYSFTVNGAEQYVKASFGGTSIEEVSEDNSDLCYNLKDEVSTVIGEMRGVQVPSLKGQAGALKMTISWTYQCDVDMDLTMTGNDAVIYDIKDVEGAGKEHLVIPSLFDIKPGDYYVFNANGKQLPDSTVTEEMLAEDPIEVRALLETTRGDYFSVWPLKSFASLDLGDFAEVNVYEKIQPEWICPAVNNKPDWYRPYNADTKAFDCLYCPKEGTVRYRQPTYKDAYEFTSLCGIRKIKVKKTNGGHYCDIKCPDLPDYHNMYNQDTGKNQCVYCAEPNKVRWRAATYQENRITCEKNSYEWRDKRDGGWYCSTKSERTYNACSEEEKKSTCGCVPCEYIVTGLTKRVENGPIAGAKVEIIKAMDADGINPTVLYRGSTTDKEDIFQSGLLEIPDDTLAKFEDDEYYLLLAKGGKDIDRDDDMVRDAVPTDNHGTIHALIKGADLKKLPFRVNILTEAIYQVSGDAIGQNYDATTLQAKLDTTAQKLINHKLYPGDDTNRINYKDVLLWTPAVDKKALYKPFTTYVEPIIASLYADKERFDESYRLIYEPYVSNAPQLEPLALEILEGLDDDSVIAQVKTGNKKDFDHVVLQGNFSEHFSIDNEGYIHIAQSQLIEDGNRYRLLMKAVDSAGTEGSLASLTIDVNGKVTQADPTTSKPRFVSVETFAVEENTPEGTVVAKAHFEDSNQTIVSYTLSGQDSSMFVVDNQGVVRVDANATIDYEKSSVYRFSISAKNDAGNESYPVGIAIAIINQLDTPLFDLVVFEHIEENIPLGSVITTIRTDREGLGDIEKFEILSPHMPFTIDSNGTMYVSNYIDYEQKKQYDFYAIARTKYGNSNKIEIHIVVDDQRPEIGIPSLEDLTISVDENTTSGSKIGQLVLDAGATALERIALYGEDDNFRVDVNGSIYLADDATLDYETKTRYDLGARALNSRGWGNEVHIVIEVNNIADQLPTLEKFKKSVEENATAGTLIGHIMMSGASETTINAFELTGTGNENFSIDANGTIRVSQTAQLDYESKDSYLLKAIASSAVGSSSEVEVIIYILNIPENPPVLKPLTLNIEENATIGTVLGKVEEDVGGDSPIVSYRLDDNSTFSIDANGTLRVEAPLDYETQTRYTLQVTASNVVGESSPVSVTVNIINIPDGEPVLEASNFSVEENSPLGTVVGNVGIINQGRSKILNMNLTGNYSNYFSIDINGTVRVIGELNYELIKVYHLKAIASNDVANSVEVDVVIDILNVIDSPPIIYPRYSSIDMHVDENSVEDTVVGKLRIESESPLHSVVLGRYDSRNFTIDLNGTIRVAKDADLDYEYGNYTYGRYKLVSITATNDDGNTTSYVYVWLNNLPDPTIDSFTGEVLENSLEGTIVGTVNIDSATPVSDIYLSGFGSENFTIDINGTIRVAQNAVLDYEQYTTYRTIAVNAINQYGTNKKLIRIDILDIVDSPPKIGTLAYGTSIAENSQPGTKVGKVTISHETPILNVLLSGEDSEKFTIDLNGTIRVADGAVLDYDVWNTRYLRFVIEASNKFGTNSRSVTISLSNVPDPTLYQTSFWIDENSVEGTVVGTARIDSDEPLLSVSLAGVGSENFIVDLNGTVRVAKDAVLDYESNDKYDYNIRLYATNAYGTNSIRMYVNINNIPDTPPTVSVYNIFMVEDGQDFSRSVGGKYTVSITSDSSVDSVRLEGENANDFTIDTGGTIHIAQGIVIDINKTKEYNLSVIAKNSFGESEPAEVIIKVHNKAFMSFSSKDNEQTKDIVMVDLKKDIQGNMYVFGYRVKNNEKTPALIKYDNAQNIEWIKDFNVTVKTENDYIYLSELKLYIDDKRTLYLLGDIYGGTLENSISDDNQTIGNRDVFAIALDTNGTSKWIKQFGTSGYDSLVGMLMENDKLYVAVNIPNQYDVDNNASTLSEGVVYILDSSGSIQNVVQFDEINIEKIDAWNLRNNYQGFIVYSKLNNIDSVIKLDSNFSFESTYIIDEEYNIYGVFVFDDVAYTVFNPYQSIRIVKHGDNGEIWSTEEDIGERVLDVQVYHQNTGTKVLFNAGDMWTYEGMVAGCIGYYFAYDMQGEIVERRYYGLRDYPCSNPFLIDGKIYLLEQKY